MATYGITQYATSRAPSAANATSLSVTLLNPVAKAGVLLRANLTVDKSGGTVSTPPGWTPVPGTPAIHASSVTFASFYRVSTAGETPDVTFNWTTARGAVASIVETNLVTTGPVGTPVVAVGTVATITATYGAAVAGDVAADAMVGIDTANTGQWAVGGPTWTAPFNQQFQARYDADATGGVAHSFATAPITDGSTPTVTSSWDGADDAILLLTVWEQQDTAPSLVKRWVGGLTSDGFRVNTHTINTDSVRLRVGLTTGPPATVDVLGHARTQISGLTPSLTHSYELVAADDTVIGTGTVTTAPSPSTAASFSFAFASCIDNNRNPPMISDIVARAPAFFIQGGDFGYPDFLRTDQNNLSFYTENYDRIQSQSHIDNLLSNIPTDYILDDHDGTDGNDSNGLGEGRANMHSAYRTHVPHYDLPATNGSLYHTFTHGRVRFVVWDCRSDRTPNNATDDTNKTMLGAEQKQWFKDLIAAETLPVVMILSSVIWNEVPTAGSDMWGGFTTERDELLAAMSATPQHYVFLTGDSHMLAADDGTYTPGGYANFSAAPLDRPTSSKGGPWSHGTYLSTQQYGWIDVTDNATSIDVAFSGVSADGVTRIALTETYTAEAPTPPPSETSYGEFVLIDSQLIRVADTHIVAENAVDLTQAEYDALSTKDPDVTYYITG